MARPGFVRIINHSERAGTVSIHAIDDTGRRFGPVELALEAMQTRHFNSVDLESGSAAKGLAAGVGDGTGNWRLELSSELSIEALAYIRTPDGFVTSMHEVAAAIEEGSNRYHVPLFNPGSNSETAESPAPHQPWGRGCQRRHHGGGRRGRGDAAGRGAPDSGGGRRAHVERARARTGRLPDSPADWGTVRGSGVCR